MKSTGGFSTHKSEAGRLVFFALVVVAAAVGFYAYRTMPMDASVATKAIAGLLVLGALGCFWVVKGQFDNHNLLTTGIAGLLGLSLHGAALAMLFYNAGPANVAQGTDDATVTAQLDRFAKKRVELETRLNEAIPEYQGTLDQQITKIKAELTATTDPVTKIQLNDELKEIARHMLALEARLADTRQMVSRIDQEQRRLERLRESRKTLGTDEPLLAELDKVWSDVEVELSKPIDKQIGTGAIADSAVDSKLSELLAQ